MLSSKKSRSLSGIPGRARMILGSLWKIKDQKPKILFRLLKKSLNQFIRELKKNSTQATCRTPQPKRPSSGPPSKTSEPEFSRYERNPIITPNPDHDWEAFTTFNPAALELNGTTHILYRAQGFDYISRIGYASSQDGFQIDYREPTPVFEDLGLEHRSQAGSIHTPYGSGGSLGGAEDPRATLLEGRVYLFYVAYDGFNPPYLALTSISEEDFLERRWNWAQPKTVSAAGIIDKSGVLFPEKINGKYVIMHRIFPDIQLDYRDTLEFTSDDPLRTDARIPASEKGWDSRKIGAGAPPIKTKDGWLLIYYGVDDQDGSCYKIGAMLLDLEEPSKVLYRSKSPILEPKAWYETSGFKPGILYPCGAVLKGEDLIVYYGAADNYVGAAKVPLEDFLNQIKDDKKQKVVPLLKTKNVLSTSSSNKVYHEEKRA